MARVTKLASWWWSWALSLCSGAICSHSCPTDHGARPTILSRARDGFLPGSRHVSRSPAPTPNSPSQSCRTSLFTDTKATCGYTELDEKHKMLWDNPYKLFGQPNISEQNLILYSFYFLIMCVFTTYTHTHIYRYFNRFYFSKQFRFTAKLSGRNTGFPDMHYPFTGLASCQNICFLKDYHCKRARVI